ncbi:MAG: hypothetical protein JSR77_17260 [Planctomycetes bacterium]|nr:hypothetical protein [Planctomycetota bacterium]
MSWVIVGCDEAGYGPTLGPLCVGMAAVRIHHSDASKPAPDLWKLLEKGVCREPGRGGKPDARGRIAVADSKALKLANSVKSVHPLVHLERGVLTFLAANGMPIPQSDLALFEALGSVPDKHRCYAGPPRPLPLGSDAGSLAIAGNLLRSCLAAAGVELLALRTIAVCEGDFNTIIRETGNKAETTAWALGKHFRHAWKEWGRESESQRLGIVCDRLGGRAAYAGLLERELPGTTTDIVDESETRSRYVIRGRGEDGAAHKAGAAFLTEGESAHLPVALASMAAKLVRELMMARFNEYWNGLHEELKGKAISPTAGYATDARRWLEEIGTDVMGREDREWLVRSA